MANLFMGSDSDLCAVPCGYGVLHLSDKENQGTEAS